jgi:hypothetical protein
MPQIVPAGFAEVIHSMSLVNDPEPMAITYGVQFDGQAPVDAQDTVEDLHAAFASTLFGIPHSSYTLQQTELRFVVAELGPVQIAVTINPIQGTGSASPLPQNSAALFHKRSANAGRRNRGRFYLPGLGEGSVDPAGRISIGEINAFNSLAANFLAGVRAAASIAEMVILHSDGVSSAPAPTVVTFMNLDPVIATQRRRLRK